MFLNVWFHIVHNLFFSVENEDDEETESEREEDRAMAPSNQRSAPSQAKNRRTSHRVGSGEDESLDEIDDPNAILDNEGKRMCPKCQKWYNAKIW